MKINNLLTVCADHNYISALLVIAGAMLSLHYESVVRMSSRCPIGVSVGPLETALSMTQVYGMAKT